MQPVGRNHTITNDQLIDSSTGLPVPSDEPVFVLRGNNPLSVQALRDYREACVRANCPEEYIKQLDGVLASFSEYAFNNKDRMRHAGANLGREPHKELTHPEDRQPVRDAAGAGYLTQAQAQDLADQRRRAKAPQPPQAQRPFQSATMGPTVVENKTRVA